MDLFVVKLGFGTIFSVVYFGSFELSSILLDDKLPLVFVRTFSFLYDYTRLILNTALQHVAIDGEMEHKSLIFMSL